MTQKKGFKIICIVLLLAMGLFLVRGFMSPEQKISRFVQRNHTELTELAEAHLNYDTTVKKYKNVKVEGSWEGEHDIVQFYYSGFGIAPSSTYYGFYYSPDDVPVTYCNVAMPLTQESESSWTWTDGTDNGGRTVKIMPNWYYYAAWF